MRPSAESLGPVAGKGDALPVDDRERAARSSPGRAGTRADTPASRRPADLRVARLQETGAVLGDHGSRPRSARPFALLPFRAGAEGHAPGLRCAVAVEDHDLGQNVEQCLRVLLPGGGTACARNEERRQVVRAAAQLVDHGHGVGVAHDRHQRDLLPLRQLEDGSCVERTAVLVHHHGGTLVQPGERGPLGGGVHQRRHRIPRSARPRPGGGRLDDRLDGGILDTRHRRHVDVGLAPEHRLGPRPSSRRCSTR